MVDTHEADLHHKNTFASLIPVNQHSFYSRRKSTLQLFSMITGTLKIKNEIKRYK